MKRTYSSDIAEGSDNSFQPGFWKRSLMVALLDATQGPKSELNRSWPAWERFAPVLCQRALARLALSAFLAIGSVRSQEFSVDLQTFEFGAAASSGGAFSLIGNLRQSEPSPTMSGGAFAIDGSFASVTPPDASKQESLAPKLSVAISSGRLEIRWSSGGSESYALEHSPFLGSGETWSLVLAEPRNDGGDRVVEFEPLNAAQFFRLRRR